MTSRRFIFSLIIMACGMLLVLASCKKKDTNEPDPPEPPVTEDSVYYRGMDLSFQPEIRDWGTTYKDASGQPVELLPFLKEKGVNLVRLRLWHTPATPYSGLESVLEYAKEVKAHDMDILLDFHYSDTWTSPGAQALPQAWTNLSIEVLNDSIHDYTLRVLERFKAEGLLPAMVQIGNETNAGFLWNQGRVGGSYNSNWLNFTTLLKSAISAVREVQGEETIRVMLHVAGTGSNTWFFDNVAQYLVDYDVIGLSYYSIWHGTNYSAWEKKFLEIANGYSKEIMVVETGYPFTLGWNDWTNNIYGLEEQLIPGIPATPEGQAQFLKQLNATIGSLGKKGIGYCYWAPDWVAYKGPQASDASSWENVAVFDFDNKALPVLDEFIKK